MSSTPISATIPDPASSTSSSSTSSTSTTNPYVQAYDALQSEDLQELFNVSFGTQQNAALNIDSVLAQWVAIDAQEQESQAQSIQTMLNNAGSSTADATANIPTLEEVQSQSDQEAQTVLNNYSSAPAGSSIVDFSA
jgi:phage shock protein A